MINWDIGPICQGVVLMIEDDKTGARFALMFNDVTQLLRLLDDMADGAESMAQERCGRPEAFMTAFPERF